MGRWLARLSFTFLIVSALLVIQGYRELTGRAGPVNKGRVALYFVAAGIGIGLMMRGIRERHRREEEDSEDSEDSE